MKIGSLVQCIKDFPNSKKNGFNVPVKGNIYTIRAFDNDSQIFILLDEVYNKMEAFSDGYGEPSWLAKNFIEIQPPMNIDIENLIHETSLQP